MKAMELLTLLGDLEADTAVESAPQPIKKKKRRAPRIMAAAACFCLVLTAFAVWFFTPPPFDSRENGIHETIVRIDDRFMFYRTVSPSRLSPYERLRLPNEKGDILAVHGDTTFYRAADRDDLTYVLTDQYGELTVWEFSKPAYWPSINPGNPGTPVNPVYPENPINLKETWWYASGHVTDEDIAALDNTTVPTMGEILESIYGVTDASEIRYVKLEKDDAYNGKVSKKVRVKPITVRDDKEIDRFFELLSEMHPAEFQQMTNFGNVSSHDDAYLLGDAPLSAQINRDMEIKLSDGYTLEFTFYPATGLLRHTRTEMYTILSEADTAWLIDLAKIDMEWRDWGTEAPVIAGEGDETAVSPVPKE